MTFTEKTRLQTVLAGKKPDRPPVICPGGMMSAATTTVLQAGGGVFHTDAAAMAATSEAIYRHTGFENLGVPFCMTVEAEAFGSKVDLGNAGVEPCVTEYGAADLPDILRRSMPNIENEQRAQAVLAAIERLVSRNRDTPVIGNVTGPISLVTSIVDPLIFFRKMRKFPVEVTEVLQVLTEYLTQFAKLQIEAGASVIAIADPTATGEILGAANFRRFVAPLLQQLVEKIRQAGAGAIVHICGDATLLLADLQGMRGAACSFDSLVNIRKAKEMLGNIPVMGNLNTQLLHTGGAERIAQTAQALLQQEVDILAPACGISLATPRDNLQAFTCAGKSCR